jgi:hypothetical protein
VASLLTVGLIAVGVWTYQGREGEMPRVAAKCVDELFPGSDLESIRPGMPLSEAIARFESPVSVKAVSEQCLSYEYDEALLSKPPLFLTVLARDGLVAERWLEQEAFSSAKCQNASKQPISLKGYLHARYCEGSQ